jgi:hypothetical protein
MWRNLIIVVALLAIGGGAFLLLGGSASFRVIPVPLDQVPPAFLKRAQQELPEVIFDHARKLPNGNLEIRGKGKNGKVREVEFNAAGEVVEIE